MKGSVWVKNVHPIYFEKEANLMEKQVKQIMERERERLRDRDKEG